MFTSFESPWFAVLLVSVAASVCIWVFLNDWPELIKNYNATPPERFEFTRQFVNIGWIYYHGVLRLEMREEGLYFKIITPFDRVLLPLLTKTLLIPWKNLQYDLKGQGHYRIMPQNVPVRIRNPNAIARIDTYLTRT